MSGVFQQDSGFVRSIPHICPGILFMPEAVTSYSEKQLVIALQQQSEKAFDYLYENYSSALYTAILGIVNEPQAAADTLQEVFVKIWRQIGTYDDSKGRLFTWMMRICRNAAIDIIRSKEFKKNRQNLELTESVYDAFPVEMKMENVGLRKMVNQLKPELRVLVELSYFEGYTHSEIAKHLNIPEGTVKSRIRAGLLQLKDIMNRGGH